jgi:hypothetical protein
MTIENTEGSSDTPAPTEEEKLVKQFLENPPEYLLRVLARGNERFRPLIEGVLATRQIEISTAQVAAAAEQSKAAHLQAEAAGRQATAAAEQVRLGAAQVAVARQQGRVAAFAAAAAILGLIFSWQQVIEARRERIAAQLAVERVQSLAEQVAAIAWVSTLNGFVETGNEAELRRLADEVLKTRYPDPEVRRRIFDSLGKSPAPVQFPPVPPS